jgi:drug/metabolite transporter (DMT)-like permease
MWFTFSIASALFQILRNMVMKQLGHRLDDTINVWGRFTFLLPFAGVGILYTGIPAIQEGFWLNGILYAIAQVFGTVCLSKALKIGDISLVTTLMKISLIMLLIWGYFALDEIPTPTGVTGVFLSVIGVYLLNVTHTRISFWAPFAAIFTDAGQRWAFLAAVGYVPSVIFIKKMAMLSSPVFAIFFSYLFCALLITPYTLYKSWQHFPGIIRNWKSFMGLGLFATISTWFGTTAYTLTASSYVEAVKQVDILLSMLIGHFIFQESAKIRLIWPGAVIILIGMVLIQTGA